MPSITIKNIPEPLYEKIKATAAIHHRSINNEIIHQLETAFMPIKASPAERIKNARNLRSTIDPRAIDPDEMQKAKDEGRP